SSPHAHGVHQTLHGAASDGDVLPVQLAPDLLGPVDAIVAGVVHALDFRAQLLALHARWTACRVAAASPVLANPRVVAGQPWSIRTAAPEPASRRWITRPSSWTAHGTGRTIFPVPLAAADRS